MWGSFPADAAMSAAPKMQAAGQWRSVFLCYLRRERTALSRWSVMQPTGLFAAKAAKWVQGGSLPSGQVC